MAEGRVAAGCPTALEPSDPDTSPTLIGFDEFSSLCSTGHTPNILTGAVGRFLREHFSDADRIEAASLKGCVWKPQPADTTEGLVDTGILIEPIYKWNPRELGKRPAIYVKRNGQQTRRLGINDGIQVGLGRDEDGNLRMDEGDKYYVGVTGSHTVFCIGCTGAETEILAGEVFREMQHFAPVLRRDLKLKKLSVTEVTEPQVVEEHGQHFAVAVVAAWAYIEAWKLVPVAPWLKSFAVDIRAG